MSQNAINILDINSTCDKFTRTKYRRRGNFFLESQEKIKKFIESELIRMLFIQGFYLACHTVFLSICDLRHE